MRLPWFGPAMSPASSVTARADGDVGARPGRLRYGRGYREPTGALRHVADLGIRARRYAYTVNGLDIPGDPVRVELDGPDGARWAWGPEDAANRVTGTALDFCLLVTQRRHRDDTALTVTGAAARQWMSIAQAFAGPAGPGRPPSTRPPLEETDMPGPATPRRPVRIGNSSGFYGDRMEATREMVEGGPIDVLTGDYLAELTMLILWKARRKDPDAGYAKSVLAQLEPVLGTCLDRGIKIVNNAGGLNPAGLAAAAGGAG